jgi:hypothetical protein
MSIEKVFYIEIIFNKHGEDCFGLERLAMT